MDDSYFINRPHQSMLQYSNLSYIVFLSWEMRIVRFGGKKPWNTPKATLVNEEHCFDTTNDLRFTENLLGKENLWPLISNFLLFCKCKTLA